MNEEKTKGLILTKTSFGESDLIFDLLCESGERLSFFVRGGKKMKSKFVGTIQIGSFITISFSKGKNFNYPKEIDIQSKNIFDFYSKSMEAMNFFADIIQIAKVISKDFKTENLYSLVLNAYTKAQKGENLLSIYNYFLDHILIEVGFDTNLVDSVSGEEVSDKEFYYHPETNKVFSQANRPRSMDLPLVKKDEIFMKNYLQKFFYGNVTHYLRLKF